MSYHTYSPLLLLLLLLPSCGTKRQATTHHTLTQVETKQALLTDSTWHRYTIERVSVYRPDGTIEREVTTQRGELQIALEQAVSHETSTTMDATKDLRGTSAPIATPPPEEVTRTQSITQRYWAVAITVLLIIIAIYLLKYVQDKR